MKINRYSNNNLLKNAVIFIIFFGVLNSISVQAKEQSSKSLKSDELQLDEQNISLENIKREFEKQLTGLKKDLNKSFSDKIDKSLKNKSVFSIQDSLIYINLPVAFFLLLLWFLNQNQRKKQIAILNTKQDIIEKRLKELKDNNLTRNDIENIERKIIKQFQENNQKITDSKIEILGTLHKNQIHQPVNHHNNIDTYLNNNYSPSINEQVEHQSDVSSHNPVVVADPIPQFVARYNLDKQSLSSDAIATVSATETSLNKRRLGDEDKLTLEKTTQKKYLIVQEDKDYYLVPHAKIKIDEYNITTLETLFECINFSSDYSDFHLIQSAKVSKSDSELWQLEKKGKLEFS